MCGFPVTEGLWQGSWTCVRTSSAEPLFSLKYIRCTMADKQQVVAVKYNKVTVITLIQFIWDWLGQS